MTELHLKQPGFASNSFGWQALSLGNWYYVMHCFLFTVTVHFQNVNKNQLTTSFHLDIIPLQAARSDKQRQNECRPLG